jgi:ubiquinone/menaquinone biosynthesis C-methylase UbiE
MTSAYDALADNYDFARLGYSDEVYDLLVSFGLKPGADVLDIGCGTGLASGPLIDNHFPVTGIDPSEKMLERARGHYPHATWVRGTAEKLPFGDAAFDVALSAQTFHHVDRKAAMDEVVRVLKPGGIAAIWWKHLMSDDPVKVIRDASARELGFDAPASGLTSGFKEFYGSALREQIVRVVPWRTGATLSKFLRYERSREIVRETMGKRADEYFTLLESKLRERFGAGDPWMTLFYTHFVYLAKK